MEFGVKGGPPVFVHTVLFWLKKNLRSDQVAAFLDGLESLRGVPSAKAVHIGTPSSTNRPVIDRSYTYGLTVIFDDLAQHDAYQADPVHLTFVQQHSKDWERVVIYDFE